MPKHFNLVFLAAVLAAGNLPSAEKPADMSVTSYTKKMQMSPREFRVHVRALIRPVLGTIEASANQIRTASSNPVVRRGAVIWKIDTTTTMLATMMRSDPVLALADSWGYLYQTQDLLLRPDMKSKYGKYAVTASETLARVERQFHELLVSVESKEFADSFEASVREWATNYPIEGEGVGRPPIDSSMAKMLAAGSGKRGTFGTLKNLDETTTDVMTRLDLYTVYLPRLARWEAELAADDITRGIDPQEVSARFSHLTETADRIASVAETLPMTVQNEMSTLLSGVDNIVDHVFVRLMQLVVICAVLIALVLMIFGFFFGRRNKRGVRAIHSSVATAQGWTQLRALSRRTGSEDRREPADTTPVL